MGQAKAPVRCAECPETGPRRSRASAEGWLRVSHGGASKPCWLCPSCRVAHENRPRPLEQRRPVPRAAQAAILLALLGMR